MYHRSKLPEASKVYAPLTRDHEGLLDGWIPMLLASIVLIGLFLSVAAALLGMPD
jgi:hypothetical protein